jgi:colanic acid biosynthesis glycosyl transferase WcaI
MGARGDGMKIAVFNQFFWPDEAPTSQLLTDLVRQLAQDGHEVIVVCGAPGYAGTNADNRPPVTIRSSPSLPFSRGAASRLASYFSYLSSAAVRTLMLGRVDVVITMTTPPMLSVLGNIAKTLHRAHHIVWEMDVYPEIAIDVGMMRADAWMTRALKTIAHGSRRYADTVWVLGDCMRQRIIESGCAPERVHVHENWSHAELYSGPVDPQPDRVQVLYSGNLGLSHDVATLQGALVALRDDPRILVQIAGGGSKRGPLEAFAREQALSNIEFLPYCSKPELGRVLSSADVGLVTLQNGCEGAVVPSKVYGLMACGRPILFVGPERATPATVIRRFNCGWHVNPGDVEGLAETLRTLVAQPERVREAGSRARAAFLEHYDRDGSVKRLCRSIAALRPQSERGDLARAAHVHTSVRD